MNSLWFSASWNKEVTRQYFMKWRSHIIPWLRSIWKTSNMGLSESLFKFLHGRGLFSGIYLIMLYVAGVCTQGKLNITWKWKWRFLSCDFILHITIFFHNKLLRNSMQLRWSRGSVLAFGTQVRGFKPGRNCRIFQGEKILSTPSFGEEVKLLVPCHRFTACKRFLNATWKSGISGKIHRPFLAHIVPPLPTGISGETTSGESWNV